MQFNNYIALDGAEWRDIIHVAGPSSWETKL